MSDGFDKLIGQLRRFVTSAMAHTDYHALYPARVVAQNGSGTLELAPDDPRFPTLSNVPIHFGLPDVTATIQPGARVLLGFAGGDPSKPRALPWEAATITAMDLGASGPLQPIGLGTALRTELDAIWTRLVALGLHTHGGVQSGSSTTSTPSSGPVIEAKETVGSATVRVKA